MLDSAPPWRPIVQNAAGEVLAVRLVPAGIPGVCAGWREEYAWFDREGRYLRPHEA